MIHWIPLVEMSQLDEVVQKSIEAPVVLFKHSTTCSISLMAKTRLESKWDLPILSYFLDLLQYRSISNKAAEVFSVQHESPQILLIHNGQCIYDASHLDITVSELKEVMAYENLKVE